MSSLLLRPHSVQHGGRMESLFNSFIMVTVAEIGDKTQLLSLLLIQKFKKPWPIIWGILFSTLANHYMAAWLGGYVVDFLPEAYRTWILAAIFIIFAFWILRWNKAIFIYYSNNLNSSCNFNSFLFTKYEANK